MTPNRNVLALLPLLATVGQEADPRSNWLREQALPFTTVEAGNGFEDLRPLKAWIGDARIVALGEGTHGTREFFQMKHRLLEFLATEMGFTVFAIEASTPEAHALDPYVLGGPGDVDQLIAGMYFWTWHTEEVKAMVEWMRAFNAAGHGPLHFTGFDMQTPDVAMRVVTDFLQEVDPEHAEDVRRMYTDLKSMRWNDGFGTATGRFPVELARGKRVRFHGWIRCEGVTAGYAGLWWRNDLPGGLMGGLDNMHDRGARGTLDWREYSLEMDVPEETTSINFGLMLVGTGQAWFDDVTIELDGQPFEDPELFDLGFESGVSGLTTFIPGYRIEVVDEGSRAGARCLSVACLGDEPQGPDPAAATALAGEVLEGLRAEREALVRERGREAFEWAVHNARIVQQCLESRMGKPENVRDRAMAENVEWILEQDPGARIVLWAHNAHVARRAGWMGQHLAQRFGSDYLPVGFFASEGRYVAIGDGRLGDHPLAEPPAGSLERLLEGTGQPRLLLDLRRAEAGDPTADWLHGPLLARSIGAMALKDQFDSTPSTADAFDLLVYVRTTTPAVQLAR